MAPTSQTRLRHDLFRRISPSPRHAARLQAPRATIFARWQCWALNLGVGATDPLPCPSSMAVRRCSHAMRQAAERRQDRLGGVERLDEVPGLAERSNSLENGKEGVDAAETDREPPAGTDGGSECATVALQYPAHGTAHQES